MAKLYRHIVFTALFAFVFLLAATAQIRISGTVYDITRIQPLPAVSILSSSGTGTVTDSNGHYSLMVLPKDSIWFSYLNKSTPKYAVATIGNYGNFDISLHVPVTELREVRVLPRNYKIDSLQNRIDYAKVFDYRKPGLRINSAPYSGQPGVGLDLNELIGMFQFRKNKRMLAFQQRLITEEQEKYIDHRFSKALVKKITGATGKTQDDFMKRYRPSYEFVTSASDYDLAEYIKLAYENYEMRIKGF